MMKDPCSAGNHITCLTFKHILCHCVRGLFWPPISGDALHTWNLHIDFFTEKFHCPNWRSIRQWKRRGIRFCVSSIFYQPFKILWTFVFHIRSLGTLRVIYGCWIFLSISIHPKLEAPPLIPNKDNKLEKYANKIFSFQQCFFIFV